LRDAGLALSLANLCFIEAWFTTLFDGHYGYFNKAPVTSMALLALLLNIFGAALFFWIMARLMRRLENDLVRAMAHLVYFALLLVPLNFVRHHYSNVIGFALLDFAHRPLFLVSLLVVAIPIVRWHKPAARLVSSLVLILLPLSFFTLGKIALLLLHVQSLAQSPLSPGAPPALSEKNQPHVVWILFDEMDQRLAFSERPVSLQLPELDRICKESFSATEAYAPAGSTLESLPALITGRLVSAAVPCSPSDLAITWSDSGTTVAWSAQPNIFSRARELEVNTGLVGWYHPYERLFGSSLNYCSWYAFPQYEISRGETFSATFVNQLWSTVPPLQYRRLHLDLYQHALDDALRVVTNGQLGLILLHLPVPHLPCIYSSATQQFTVTSFSRQDYFNTLALADRTLGALRSALEKAGAWDKSWLLISADHGWRDAPSYDGKLDHRVPFILKTPGVRRPASYASPFNTVLTQDLLLSVLQQELTSAEQIVPWLERHRFESGDR